MEEGLKQVECPKCGKKEQFPVQIKKWICKKCQKAYENLERGE